MSAQVLGNARHGGAMKLAREAMRRLRECGEAAVLLGAGGDVVLMPHWSPDYAGTLTRRSTHLCGIYRMPADEQPCAINAASICADMIESWRGLKVAA
jgi:hypothetical protein